MIGDLLGRILVSLVIAAIISGGMMVHLVGDRRIALIVALATALVVVVTWLVMILRRLASLANSASVASGDVGGTDARPSPMRGDEIDRLAAAFGRIQRRIDEQIRRAASLEVRNRELIANVSHDLRTPLASMRGYLETLLLKQGSLSDEQQRHYLEVAEKHCDRLGKLITDLFEFTKFEANEVELRAETFPATELLQDIAQKFDLDAAHKGVRIETDFDRNIPAVHADIGMIERVLENLIGNALRHCDRGDEIRLLLARQGSRVSVEVADTGSGIAAEQLPKIFDRFFQGERGRDGAGQGAGLGLAIAKRILELHGSTIDVQSAVGAGTRFRFELPVAQTPDACAVAVPKPSGESG